MAGIEIIYDGDCPFCSRYVMMMRLRETVGQVKLVDARSDEALVNEVKALGFNLNKGMLARYNGRDYFGADCIHLLSMLSSKAGMVNRFNSALFSNRHIARLTYPLLRSGRNATLRFLGRSPIS